jgi:tRNA-dependent cyclodipeptide synthase
MFTLTPLTSHSTQLIERADHIVIGLSPWNGCYKPGYIRDLMAWAHTRFRGVDVVTPGYEAAYTLIAAGVTPAEAVRRARRATRQLHNPVIRELAELGVADPAAHVHSWTRLLARAAYRASLERAREVFRRDSGLRRACRRMTSEVIGHATTSRGPVTSAQMDMAVPYIIAEIPLITDGPSVFGTPGTVFVYHRQMELVSSITEGYSTLTADPGQGWAIATPVGAQHDNHTDDDPTRYHAALEVPVRAR